VDSYGLPDCLDWVEEASGWKERRRHLGPNKGLGVACSHYVSGAAKPVHWTGEPHAVVNLKLDFDGGITILTGAAEIGQGSSTVLAQVVGEVLGLDFDRLTVIANENGGTSAVVARSRAAGATDERAAALGMTWPSHVYSLAHVSLPFPPDDPIYGEGTTASKETRVQLGVVPADRIRERRAAVAGMEVLVADGPDHGRRARDVLNEVAKLRVLRGEPVCPGCEVDRPDAERLVEAVLPITTNLDIGLLQVNLGIWGRRFGVTAFQLLDPATNLRIGCRILRQALGRDPVRGGLDQNIRLPRRPSEVESFHEQGAETTQDCPRQPRAAELALSHIAEPALKRRA